MPTEITTTFEFENLCATFNGRPDLLFGTAEILFDRDRVTRGSWCIGTIKVSTLPELPMLQVRVDTEVHDILRFELTAQRCDQIDDLVKATLEKGGYAKLFGERMPSWGGSRCRTRAGFYIPGSPVQDRAMSKTFAL